MGGTQSIRRKREALTTKNEEVLSKRVEEAGKLGEIVHHIYC